MASSRFGSPQQRALDQAAASLTPLALAGVGAIFLVFSLADLAFYPPELKRTLFLVDFSCGVMLATAGGLMFRRRLSPKLAHPALASSALVISANTLFGMWLGAEPVQSIYLILVLMGVGSVFLSLRWTAAVAGGTLAGWLATAWRFGFDWDTTQYALGLFAACLASALVCGVRIRLFRHAESLRERLDAVATRAPIVLFTLDEEGVFTFASGRGLEHMGVAPESLVGRSIFHLYAAADDVAQHVQRALAGETFTTTVNDSGRSFLVSYGPIRRDGEKVVGVVGVATDITDQAVAERELEASRKHMARQERLAAIGTLVAGVAHEINNPLAFVRGNTQVIQDVLRLLDESPNLQEDEKRDVRDAIGLVGGTLEGIDRLAHISESLRNVARSGNGRRGLEDLNMVARMSLTVARPRLGKTLVVEESLEAAQAVLADRGELGQVVLNLLINAGDELHASGHDEPRVAIRSFDQGDKVVLEVEDNGRGIPVDKQDLVFAPFVTTKPNGTGLGLSISHRIVHDHGGALSFRSQVGVGTVFRVELPAAQPDRPPLVEDAPVAARGSLPV